MYDGGGGDFLGTPVTAHNRRIYGAPLARAIYT
jgi:hypothetical protein